MGIDLQRIDYEENGLGGISTAIKFVAGYMSDKVWMWRDDWI